MPPMTGQPSALRALVVEDDAAIREKVGLHLGLAGFAVEDVADGRQALEQIAGSDSICSCST